MKSVLTSSINNYLGIIALLHKEFGLPNPLVDDWVLKSLLSGIKRVKGSTVKQKLPITLDILLGIRRIINLNISYDASFWAVCLTAFFGVFKKCNLLSESDIQYDPNEQFSWSRFQFFHWGALVQVSWSKTIQFRERSVCIPLPYIPYSLLCPASSVLHAMSFTKMSLPTSHAFAYFDPRSRKPTCLTYQSFLSKLGECISRLGFPQGMFASHSFRRGGASFAFQSGVPVELIKMLGDWKSDAVLLYLTVPLSIRLQSINMMSKAVIQHCAH